MTETIKQTQTSPMIRTVFGFTQDPTLPELVAVLDGLAYMMEMGDFPQQGSGGPVITVEFEGEELGFLDTGLDWARVTSNFVMTSTHLRVVSISYNSPFEIILGITSFGAAFTLVASASANRLITVIRNWQQMKQEKVRVDLAMVDVRIAKARACELESRARVSEAAANYLIKELGIKTLETDTQRLSNAAQALEAITSVELLAEQ